MAGFVWVHHPETGGVAFQPADAVDDLWAAKGFVQVDIDLTAASAELGVLLSDLRQVPQEYVQSVAASRSATSTPPPAPVSPSESEPTSTRRRGGTSAKEA